MRCLYCGKKLSLLKLAKGDSFCSPEHFDAFQLQESKSAFERLISLGEPEARKAPLVSKAVEPEAEPVKVDARPVATLPELPLVSPEPQPTRVESRASAVEPTEVIENNQPVDAPVAQQVEPQAPPRAPFTDQGRPLFFDAPHNIANSEDSENPILPKVQEVAWPIHETHGAEGILNLHLQVQLAGIEPAAWGSKREPIAEVEPFAHAEVHPSMEARPELPQVEFAEPAEPEAPAAEVEEPQEIEAHAPTVEAPPVEPEAWDAKPEDPPIEYVVAAESEAPPAEIDASAIGTEAPAAEIESAVAKIETPQELEAPAATIEAPLVELEAGDAKPEDLPIEHVAAAESEAPSETEAPPAEIDASASETEALAAEIESAVAKIEAPQEIEAPAATIEAPLVELEAGDAKPEDPPIEHVAAAEPEAPAAETEAPAKIDAVAEEAPQEIEGPAAVIEEPVVEPEAADLKIELPQIEHAAVAKPEAPALEIETPPVEATVPEAKVEVIAAKVEPPKGPSIAYLPSPSFLPRIGLARFFDSVQPSTVNGFAIPSSPGKREISGIEPREMPSYTQLVKATPVAARNSVVRSTVTVAELPTSPAPTFPAAQQNLCGVAWTVANRLIAIPVPTLNAILPKPRAADFDLPRAASFLVRPDPAMIRAVDPQKMARGLDTKSAFRGNREMVPCETKRTIFQAAGAFDGLVSTMLLECHEQPVSPPLPWKSNANTFTLEYPMAPQEFTWTSALSALVYSATPVRPSPYWVVSVAMTPWSFVSEHRRLASRLLDAFLEGRPVAYGPIVQISINHPSHAPIPPRSMGCDAVGFLTNWEGRMPAPLGTRTARFLPVRDTQQLPAARPWPKLGALPR